MVALASIPLHLNAVSTCFSYFIQWSFRSVLVSGSKARIVEGFFRRVLDLLGSFLGFQGSFRIIGSGSRCGLVNDPFAGSFWGIISGFSGILSSRTGFWGSLIDTLQGSFKDFRDSDTFESPHKDSFRTIIKRINPSGLNESAICPDSIRHEYFSFSLCLTFFFNDFH